MTDNDALRAAATYCNEQWQGDGWVFNQEEMARRISAALAATPKPAAGDEARAREVFNAANNAFAMWMGDPDGKDDLEPAYDAAAKVIEAWATEREAKAVAEAVAAKDAEIQRLNSLLDRYGGHKRSCGSLPMHLRNGGNCECGWQHARLRAPVEPAKGE